MKFTKAAGLAAATGMLLVGAASTAQAMLQPMAVAGQAVHTVDQTFQHAIPDTGYSLLYDRAAHHYLAGNPAGRYIVVLGARLNADGTLPGILDARLDRAAAIARAQPGSQVIVSGGATQALPYNEAQAMLAGLTLRGVNPLNIIMEERSYSTVGNASNTAAILSHNRAQGAVIVSSASHIDRAMGNFRNAAPYLHFIGVGTPGW